MKVSDLNYDLPNELLAREPREFCGQKRSDSKLLVMDRENDTVKHCMFDNIINYLEPGDVLVLNNSRTIKADLLGWYNGCKRVNIQLGGILANGNWQAYSFTDNLEVGSKIVFGNGELICELISCVDKRLWQVKFNQENIIDLLDLVGRPIMSPYVKEKYDLRYYQNVYSKIPGSTELPAAGRHFTKKILNQLKDKGIKIVYVTLHTGLSSIEISSESFEEHSMHEEQISISEKVANIINVAKNNNHKIFGVGTTVVRTLESAPKLNGKILSFNGYTDLYIYPGYKFKVIDAFITNFHGPKSSRIAMASAFTGSELLMKGYQEAIDKKYMFYEFGDTTLTI